MIDNIGNLGTYEVVLTKIEQSCIRISNYNTKILFFYSCNIILHYVLRLVYLLCEVSL